MSSIDIAGFFRDLPSALTTVGFSSFFWLKRADPGDREKREFKDFSPAKKPAAFYILITGSSFPALGLV
jgi:hypothetical protein